MAANYIQAIGPIWWPNGSMAAQFYPLSSYDLDNIRAYGEGTIDRDAVESWLNTHAGDFQHVADFRAVIQTANGWQEIDWSEAESELTYNDCMFGDDE